MFNTSKLLNHVTLSVELMMQRWATDTSNRHVM